MQDSVRNYWVEFNEPLEGRVHYMYCDQRGWVSTGVGNLIDATQQANTPPTGAERAASLSMANEFNWTGPDGSAADGGQVATDWDAVNRMIGVKVDQMESFPKSRNAFSDFDDWPADAQLALLSMAWGMGPAVTGDIAAQLAESLTNDGFTALTN